MKKIFTIIKFLFLVVINVFACALDIIFYTNGLMDNLLCFLPIALFLTCLNYCLCNKTVHLIIIQSLAAVSCFICTAVSVLLYSKYICGDVEGYIVSVLFVFGQIAIFAYISSAAVIRKEHRITKNENKQMLSNRIDINKKPLEF